MDCVQTTDTIGEAMSPKKPSEPLRIVQTDRLDGKLVISYSDKSTAVYGVEQLAGLIPKQLVTDESLDGREQSDL